MKRIAVWNTAFLGDAVLTLPLIQTLADAFPGSEIDFYVRRGLASLFEAHPALHAVYEYDKRRIAGNNRLSALLKSGRILGGRRYDIWIGAHPSLYFIISKNTFQICNLIHNLFIFGM